MMKKSFVRYCRYLIAALVLGAAGTVPARSDEAGYPTKAIKVILPTAAGGSTDVASRLLAHRMSEALKQMLVVENRVGATGAIGMLAGIQAPADGYTILAAFSSALVINPHVTKVAYDIERDLRPISGIMKAETLIVANPSKGLKSLKDVVAYAKAHPGKLTFGSIGVGSAFHLAMAYLQTRTDVDMLHVPYKGSVAAEQALMTGEIDLLIVNTVSSLPHIEAGKMLPIALLSSGKSELFPKLPAASDFLPGYVFDTWLGLYAPAKTSDAIIHRLNGAATEALKDEKLIQAFHKNGMEPMPSSPEELRSYESSESKRWAQAAAAAKAKGWLN